MSESPAKYISTGASRSPAAQAQDEAEAIRERIKATLEHSFPALAAFLAHGEAAPVFGEPLRELSDDAAALADLMAIFPPGAPEQPLPETTAHVAWLINRLLTTGQACRSSDPGPRTRSEGAAVATLAPSSTDHPAQARAEHILAKQHDRIQGDPKAAEVAREFIAEGRSAELHINPKRDGWPARHPGGKNLVVLAAHGVHRQHWYVDQGTVEALRPLADAA